MENTTQMRRWLPLMLALALPSCRPAPSPYASYGGEPLTPLRPDSALFTSADGRIFLRLPYRTPHEDTSHDPPYVFFDTLQCDYFNCIKTSDWLDVPTFRRVPGAANYWMDKRAIYSGPNSRPGQLYFFELGLVGQVRFAADPDTAFVGSQGWYRGVPLEWGPRLNNQLNVRQRIQETF